MRKSFCVQIGSERGAARFTALGKNAEHCRSTCGKLVSEVDQWPHQTWHDHWKKRAIFRSGSGGLTRACNAFGFQKFDDVVPWIVDVERPTPVAMIGNRATSSPILQVIALDSKVSWVVAEGH